MSVRSIILLLFIFLSYLPAFSQKALQAGFLENPPIIDGLISTDEWMINDSATQFIQMEPRPGDKATEKTIAYIGYDHENIYVAIICYHQKPSEIVARIQQRDHLTKNDDIIAVILDTYHDKRTGYVFFVNPIGTQIDMRVTDDGRNMDLNWDTEWESAAGINNKGWVAELTIPFKSIKYKSGLNTWGVNVGRVIRKNAETVYWSDALSDDFRISQSGILTDIQVPSSKPLISLFPYGTMRYEDSDITKIYQDWKPDVGIDAEINLTSQFTGNLTVNPDFATVEGDQEEINLTRWEIRFPEKRLFFLEGNEMFNTRIRTFYSRRVGDIYYGGKLTGKIGKMNMNLLSARSVEEPEINEPSAWYSAFRLKRDFLKSSFIGLTFVDKSWNHGFTRSMSADYLLNLGKTWKLTGQFVGSVPGNLITHNAWFVRFARENNIYHYHIRYSNTGENFQDNVNQTGFIRDDDMREVDSDITYRWWVENNWIKYIRVGSLNNIFWNHQNVLRSWYITEYFRLYLQNRVSMDLSYNNEYKLYEKNFYNHQYGVEMGYNTDEWSSANLSHFWGRNYDRNFTLTRFVTRFKPVSNLALEYSFDILKFRPDPDNNSAFINILSANYNFTRDLWIRIFAQNNTSSERIYFYGLFGWRFLPPFGAVYLIYTIDNKIMLPGDEHIKSKIFFLKLTYPIVIGK